MEQLREQHGFATVDRALRHLSIRLRSRPETAELAPEVDAERARVRQAEEAWLQAREMRIAATAEIDYLDAALDLAVADLSRLALVEVRGNRNDERYKRLFPASPSAATSSVGGEGQGRYVRALLAQLTSSSGPFPSLAGQAPTIEAALTALSESEQRRDALYIPESTAATERTAALDRARRVYNQMYPRLRLLFPDNLRLVESYFARLRGTSGRGGQDPEPAQG